jgi:diguanylate cyclase (GGDEF)-like protein
MIVQTYKVLLVEDVLMIAKITAQMLQKAVTNKYASVHRTTLAEALAELQVHEYDVVLLDLNLPDSRDLDTLTRIVDVVPDVAILVLTATNSDEIGLRAVQLGAQDYLMKGDFNYLTLDRAISYAIERHRMQRTIRQLAVMDELTGLYNRRGFNTLNPDVLQHACRSSGRGYLAYFDLDRFKQINDSLGHAKGDEALVEFAATLRGVFRKDALLVRLGGDEFVAMGIEAQPGQIEETLRTLAATLANRNARDTAEFQLECSCGVAYFDGHGPASLEEITAQADAELYRNKEKRRRARTGSAPQLHPQGEHA